MHDDPNQLLLAHSPDPDDAFMWWPLGTSGIRDAPPSTPRLQPSIETGEYSFTPVAHDIQALNQRAMTLRDLHITAMSVFALGHVLDTYAMTTCGASFGLNFGPKVLDTHDYAKKHRLLNADDAAREKHLNMLVKNGGHGAVPGTETSAYLTLRLLLESTLPPGAADKADTRFPAMRFDRVIPALLDGDVDAALVIHEAQVTYQDQGLHLLVDLGQWWGRYTGGLPLPLGANAIRKDVPSPAKVTALLHESIDYALANREQSVDYAMHFASANAPDNPPSREQVDTFIERYGNELTIDLTEPAVRAVSLMLHHGRRLGMLPQQGELTIASAQGLRTVPIADSNPVPSA